MNCSICQCEVRGYTSLAQHIRRNHDISSIEYYDQFLNIDNFNSCKNINCSNKPKFHSINKGYNDYCSKKCSNSDPKKIIKYENTCLKLYNVSNPFKSQFFKDQIKHIHQKKYGENNPSKVEEFKRKKEKTCLKKYGVYHHSKAHPIKDKVKKSRLKYEYLKIIPFLKDLNIELLDNYNGICKTISVKCLKCNNIFNSEISNLKQNCRLCKICNPKLKGISKPESEIFNFIKSICDDKIIQNSTRVISPKEIDIYIPSKNIAIEFNGLYWHSEEVLTNSENYHLNKTELCKKQGIQLIHIFEDEWMFKKDIVKSKLRNILKEKCENIVNVEECLVKEISSKVKNDFLNEYHIQGKDNSIVKLGSFYRGELISIMTFLRISKSGIWKLNRFCSKSNYQISEMALNLLFHFKKNYKWKEIFSYADRRWSIGDIYYHLGFELEQIIKPNYWYLKNRKRIHRFNFRKRKDEPKEIPEWVLRQQEGLYRIWDCGNLKFSVKI